MNYKVGTYIRLSKEDNKTGESESVSNQREFINQYLKHHNLTLEKEYIDDGYSGTTFDRPAFNELISDIEKGNINMVITKDLSRLGRNYLKSGYYIEEYFPLKKVRYVAILDNVDTLFNDNDIAPFKALFNDMVSKDISKKIKSILVSKKKQGMYLGSKAPYGYKKNKDDKHKLIMDKNYIVVKKIYNYFLNGKSINDIVNYLNKKNIVSPSKGLWSYISVYNILTNEVYTGKLVQNVWTNISYKNKKRIKRNKKEWIVINNSHKAIIRDNVFNDVQKKLKRKSSTPIKKRSKLLLEGLIFCKECNHLIGLNYNKKRDKWYLICNSYKKNTNNCTSHYMDYSLLEEKVLNLTKKYLDNKYIIDNSKNIKKIENKLNILYEDRLNGIINLKEYKDLKEKLEIKKNNLFKEQKMNINRDLLFHLIDKICINKNKEIFIYYKFKKPN